MLDFPLMKYVKCDLTARPVLSGKHGCMLEVKLTTCKSERELDGGNSNICYFHPDFWGFMIQLTVFLYFSDGLVQPSP